jgi:hypothetical protein
VSGLQSRVCSGDIAGLEQEEVAWNDRVGWHHDAVTVPHDACAWRGHRAQRQDGSLRAVFLKKPDGRIDDHNRANRESVEAFAERCGQDAGRE